MLPRPLSKHSQPHILKAWLLRSAGQSKTGEVTVYMGHMEPVMGIKPWPAMSVQGQTRLPVCRMHLLLFRMAGDDCAAARSQRSGSLLGLLTRPFALYTLHIHHSPTSTHASTAFLPGCWRQHRLKLISYVFADRTGSSFGNDLHNLT